MSLSVRYHDIIPGELFRMPARGIYMKATGNSAVLLVPDSGCEKHNWPGNRLYSVHPDLIVEPIEKVTVTTINLMEPPYDKPWMKPGALDKRRSTSQGD